MQTECVLLLGERIEYTLKRNNIVTEMEMVLHSLTLKWSTVAAKTKTMGLFTWSTNKQKYSKNISVKKAINN